MNHFINNLKQKCCLAIDKQICFSNLRPVKKIISILFLVIVSIQFLPIKQMGKCLFDNQFVEEEVGKVQMEKFKTTEPGKDLICFNLAPDAIFIERIVFSNHSTALHKPPITEILTPPPNAL